MFQQLPPPAPVTRFHTTVSLSVGERTPDGGGGIVERCEPAAVKLCRRILVQLVQFGAVESGGGLLLGSVGKQPEMTECYSFMLGDKKFPTGLKMSQK